MQLSFAVKSESDWRASEPAGSRGGGCSVSSRPQTQASDGVYKCGGGGTAGERPFGASAKRVRTVLPSRTLLPSCWTPLLSPWGPGEYWEARPEVPRGLPHGGCRGLRTPGWPGAAGGVPSCPPWARSGQRRSGLQGARHPTVPVSPRSASTGERLSLCSELGFLRQSPRHGAAPREWLPPCAAAALGTCRTGASSPPGQGRARRKLVAFLLPCQLHPSLTERGLRVSAAENGPKASFPAVARGARRTAAGCGSLAGCRGGRRSLERGTGCLSRRRRSRGRRQRAKACTTPPFCDTRTGRTRSPQPCVAPGGGSSGVVPAEPAPPLRGRRWKEGGSRRESGDSRVVRHLPPAAHLNTRCSSTCRFPNRKKPHRSQPCVHNTESFGSLEPPLWPGGAWRGLAGPGSEAQGSGSSSSWRRLECQKQADKTKQNTRTLRVPEAKRDPSTVPALRCPPGWPPFCMVAPLRGRWPLWPTRGPEAHAGSRARAGASEVVSRNSLGNRNSKSLVFLSSSPVLGIALDTPLVLGAEGHRGWGPQDPGGLGEEALSVEKPSGLLCGARGVHLAREALPPPGLAGLRASLPPSRPRQGKRLFCFSLLCRLNLLSRPFLFSF